jgi:hypothetical protein
MKWEQLMILFEDLEEQYKVQPDDSEYEVILKDARSRNLYELGMNVFAGVLVASQLKKSWNKLLVPHAGLPPISWREANLAALGIGGLAFLIGRSLAAGWFRGNALAKATDVLRESEKRAKRARQ